jgi:hypothetical protein
MDPVEYVHLVYDDATFRRSRFYFWAIGCLSLFEKSIAGNLSHFEKIHSKAVEYDRMRGGDLEDDKVIEKSMLLAETCMIFSSCCKRNLTK